MTVPNERWYTYFFGVRGFLRLCPIFVVLVFGGFVSCALGQLPRNGGFPVQLIESVRLSVYFWRTVLMMSFLFAFFVWFLAIHREKGWTAGFSEKCRNFDWWGRRVVPSVNSPNRVQRSTTRTTGPQCGSETEFITIIAERSRYRCCSRCGWNCVIVSKQLRGNIRAAIAVGIVGLLFAMDLFLKTDWRRGLAPAVLVAVVPLSVSKGVTAFRRLRRLEVQTLSVMRNI